MKTKIGQVAALGLLMITTAALAQSNPVAGEVAEGSLKGKTLTFVSYGGIYQDGQIAALKEFVDKSGVTLLSDRDLETAGAGRVRQCHLGRCRYRRFPALRLLRQAVPEAGLLKDRYVQHSGGPDQRMQRAGHELWCGADVQHRKVQG
jgi:hypothetical protein